MSALQIHRILRATSLAGTVGALALVSSNALAAKRLYEGGTAEAGEQLVAYASSGAVNEAFESAHELRRPNDLAFAKYLDSTRERVASHLGKLGGLTSSVHQTEEFRFAGCLTREYSVRYRNGEQRWRVKFRRGSAGWHLSDLSVATMPPRRGLMDMISSVVDPEPR